MNGSDEILRNIQAESKELVFCVKICVYDSGQNLRKILRKSQGSISKVKLNSAGKKLIIRHCYLQNVKDKLQIRLAKKGYPLISVKVEKISRLNFEKSQEN